MRSVSPKLSMACWRACCVVPDACWASWPAERPSGRDPGFGGGTGGWARTGIGPLVRIRRDEVQGVAYDLAVPVSGARLSGVAVRVHPLSSQRIVDARPFFDGGGDIILVRGSPGLRKRPRRCGGLLRQDRSSRQYHVASDNAISSAFCKPLADALSSRCPPRTAGELPEDQERDEA